MTSKWHEAINLPNAILQRFQALLIPGCTATPCNPTCSALSSSTSSSWLLPILHHLLRVTRPGCSIVSVRSRRTEMLALLLRACVVASIAGTALATLPPYIKACKRSDPDIDRCITKSIEDLRDKLRVGIAELEVPAIEPLTLKQIRLLRGPEGARLDINLTNIEVSGPSTFKIRDLKANVDDVSFTFKVSFDGLSFRGKYQIDARLLLLRLVGNGDLTGNFTDYDSEVLLRAKRVTKDNGVYLTFEKMKIAIKIGKANVYLSNLFGGDPILGPASNQVLNANSDLLLDELRPVLESALAELFTDVTNKITRSFTYDELFPDA